MQQYPIIDLAVREDAAKADIRVLRPSLRPWLISLCLHGLLLAALLHSLPSGFADAGFYTITLEPGAETRTQNAVSAPGTGPETTASAAVTIQAAAQRTGSSPPAAGKTRAAEAGGAVYETDGEGSIQTGSIDFKGADFKVYTAGQVDYKPQPVYMVRPVYPYQARRRGIEGWVEVRFLVSREGLITREEVTQAQPEGVFENSALDALRAWRFSPGMIAGRKVDTWMVQVIRFKLTRAG
jgi:TonB family protein